MNFIEMAISTLVSGKGFSNLKRFSDFTLTLLYYTNSSRCLENSFKMFI